MNEIFKKLKVFFLSILMVLSAFTSFMPVNAIDEAGGQGGAKGTTTKGDPAEVLWITKDWEGDALYYPSSATDIEGVIDIVETMKTSDGHSVHVRGDYEELKGSFIEALSQAYNEAVNNYVTMGYGTASEAQPRVVAIGVAVVTGGDWPYYMARGSWLPGSVWHEAFNNATNGVTYSHNNETYTAWQGFANNTNSSMGSLALTDIPNSSTSTDYILRIVCLNRNEPQPENKSITVTVTKTSTLPNCTTNNAMYPLDKAIFGVYTDSACKDDSKIGEITTDTQGKGSGTYTVKSSINNLYVKELQAPNNYLLTETGYKVLDVSGTGDKTVNVSFEDVPINDPAAITITKVDKEGKANAAPMGEAQFTLTYYDSLADDFETQATTKKEWVIKTIPITDGNSTMYVAKLDDEHFVSGDDLYRDAENENAPFIPIGTLTMKETKAATNYTVEGGYLQNNATKDVISSEETMIFKVVNENSAAVMKVGNQVDWDGGGIKEELTIRGGFKLQKNDLDYDTRSQGDTTLAGAEFDLYYLGSGEDGTGNYGKVLLLYETALIYIFTM